MKLLLNEMWPLDIAVQLRRRGFDVVAATEPGWEDRYRGIPDDEVFRRAQDDERAIVTDNIDDYGPIHADYEGRGKPHFGVVYALWPKFDRGQPRIVGSMVRSIEHLLRCVPDVDEPVSRAHYLKHIDR